MLGKIFAGVIFVVLGILAGVANDIRKDLLAHFYPNGMGKIDVWTTNEWVFALIIGVLLLVKILPILFLAWLGHRRKKTKAE